MRHRSPIRTPLLLTAATCALVVAGIGGCAQSFSADWAQTAPVIQPTARPYRSVLLGAQAEVVPPPPDEQSPAF